MQSLTRKSVRQSSGQQNKMPSSSKIANCSLNNDAVIRDNKYGKFCATKALKRN